MFRDFSESAKQQLLGYVDEVTPKNDWARITDAVGDIGLTVQRVLGQLNISNYINNVSDYHRKIIDKNNATAKQIEQIFSDVQGVDTSYMGYVSEQVNYGQQIARLISDMANIIDPNGGNMSVAKMNQLLAADIEAMEGAQATVAKTIEEEMQV